MCKFSPLFVLPVLAGGLLMGQTPPPTLGTASPITHLVVILMRIFRSIITLRPIHMRRILTASHPSFR